jgi:hypothetical protein
MHQLEETRPDVSLVKWKRINRKYAAVSKAYSVQNKQSWKWNMILTFKDSKALIPDFKTEAASNIPGFWDCKL